MEIKREDIGNLNELITIHIAPEDYQAEVEKSLKELKRKANVPGFRKGNVPMGMINKMYGKSVLAEEITKLTNHKIFDYLKEEKLDILFEPLAHPEKTEGDFDKPADFSFSFEIGLRPEIKVNFDTAKKITNYKIVAEDKEIDTEVMSMRKRVGKFSSNEIVAEDDMLLVTVTPEEGDEFTSSLILNYIKDSEMKNFVGKKLHDEMDIDTVKIFKSDYERSTFLKSKMEALETAPKKVHIKIDAIHHMEPADLDGEFFEKMFPDGQVTDEVGLRENIKKQIELRHVNDANMIYRNKVMEALLEATPVELPDEFIKKYLVETKEQYTNETIEETYPDIKKSVDFQLIEEQLTRDFEINIEKEEVMNYIESYIRQSYFGTTETLSKEQEDVVHRFVGEMVQKEENVKNAYENIFFEKLTQGFKNKLNPKVKELSFEKFVDEVTGKKEKETKETKEVKEPKPKAKTAKSKKSEE
jgi:trigger factor